MISPLKILANIQLEYTDHIIVGCVLLTALMATGIPNIELQTDFQSKPTRYTRSYSNTG